jgi:hypothetical protein
MKFLGITVFFSLFCTLSAFSQTNLSVSGTLIDENHEPVVSGTVVLLHVKDSTYVAGDISNTKGEFSIQNLKPNSYILKVTNIGYLTLFKNISLNGKIPATGLGELVMRVNDVLLKEAVVEGKRPEVTVKGDTTEYDAASYKAPENAVVEDLLKKLPGVEIDKDGNITSQGKSVTKVFVNNKEFFRDDPQVATKNMPADMVEKVQIYDRKSDMAQMTGFDNGDEETVMNLTLPRGMMQGTIGMVQVGAGNDVQAGVEGEKDVRYNENAFVRHQSGSDSYTGIVGLNDTNNMGGADIGGSGGGGGGRGGFGNMSGITRAQNYMLNINKEIKPDTFNINGDIRYRKMNTRVSSYTDQQNFYQNWTQQETIDDKNFNSRDNFNSNLKIDWNPNKQNAFIFRPNISFNQSDRNSTEFDKRMNMNDQSVLLDSKSLTSSKGNTFSYGGSLDYSFKFPKAGRVLSVSMNGNYSNNNSPQRNITYYPENSLDSLYSFIWKNQMAESKSLSNNFRATLSYVEPLGYNNFIQLVYRFSYSETESKNSTYDILQDMLAAALDTALLVPNQSRTTLRNAYDQRIGLNFKMERKKYNLTLGFNVDPSRASNETYQPKAGVIPPQLIPPGFDGTLPLIKGDSLFSTTPIKVVNFSPTVNFRYRIDQRSNLRIIYEGDTDQPSVNQLRDYDYVDINRPNDISRGNPDLKPGYTNNIRGEFRKYIPKNQMMYGFNFGGNYIINDIISITSLRESGVGNITTYSNVNGNWNANLSAMINVPLNKKFSVGDRAMTSLSNANSFIGTENQLQKNTMQSRMFGDNMNLKLQLNDSLYIGATGGINYSKISYTAVPDQNQNLYNYSFGTNILWTFLPRWIFDSDLNRTWRNGYAEGYNTAQTIWNAAITKVLFKKQSGTVSLKLQIYDILQDRKNISASQSASNLQFSQANVIPSYFMASFIYRFSIFPKSSILKEGDMAPQRRFDGGGGRPPGGGGFGGRGDRSPF